MKGGSNNRCEFAELIAGWAYENMVRPSLHIYDTGVCFREDCHPSYQAKLRQAFYRKPIILPLLSDKQSKSLELRETRGG